ncbi:putative 26S proteasome complex subunit sem-1 [Erysiphe neolycopersici]|uniref:26S proteasome complex subunit SEM1 n=1 Tax=Erysiphe neolycopersici TaxID=212602 RepID=A0A420HRN9_9PEZI|nr:putative 26S proteasome complex subunit sem-1 [Erysiphe neolycopersici]
MSGISATNTGQQITNTPRADKPGTEKEVKQVAAASLEEDDEFEDFPIENWGPEETEGANNNLNLWEESWDDDDTSEDFSTQLKEELKKVNANKKN